MTLAVLAVLAVVSTLAATTLRVDTDSTRMLNPELPFQIRAQAINAAFPAIKNTILVVVRGPHQDAVIATTDHLATALGRETAAVSRVFAPAVDPFFVTNGLLYGDVEALRTRLSRLGQSANLLARLRAQPDAIGFLDALDRAMTLAEGGGDPADLAPLMTAATTVFDAAAEGRATPFDWSGAFDADADAGTGETNSSPGEREPLTALISIEPVLDFTRVNAARPAIDAVRAAIDAVPADVAALVEIGVTGDPALRGEELQSVTRSLPISLGLSLVLVALVLWLSLGRWPRVLLALGAVVTTLLLTTGAAAVTVGSLNLVSVAFVVLMVGLGIDFAIHFLAHLDEEARAGHWGVDAVSRSMRQIGGALLLSAATTATAFLAFTTGDFVGMAQLGVIGAAGVLIAVLVALTLIPAALALRPGLGAGRGPLAVPRLPPLGPRGLVVAAGGLALAAAALAPSVRFDADPMALRNPAAPSVVAYGWLAADPSLAPLRLSVMAADPADAAAVAASAEALDGVRSAIWLGDLVPEAQDEKLLEIDLAWPSLDFAVNGTAVDLASAATDPSALPARLRGFPAAGAADLGAALAKWQAAVAEGGVDPATADSAIFRFFPQLMARLGRQLDVGPVAAADLPAPLTARFVAGDGRTRVEITAEGDLTDPARRSAFVDIVASALPEAGGAPAQIEGAARAVGGAMLTATLLSLAATGLLAALMLRSARMVLAILVPLALAGIVTVAVSVMIDKPFNYANVIVLPLMIGIGVDTGIHIAMRAGRVSGAAGAVFDTSTPRAALASAMTTIGAFGTLALSEHSGTASMGVMLVIALSVSLVMIFALTPAILAGSDA